jgi:hypothetical protein
MVSTGAKRASGLVCSRSDAYYRRSMLAPALRRGRAIGGARRRGGGATRPLSDAPEHLPLTNIGDRMRHRKRFPALLAAHAKTAELGN